MIGIKIIPSEIQKERTNKLAQFLFGSYTVNNQKRLQKYAEEHFQLKVDSWVDMLDGLNHWGTDPKDPISIEVSNHCIRFRFNENRLPQMREFVTKYFQGESIGLTYLDTHQNEMLFKNGKPDSVKIEDIECYKGIFDNIEGVSVYILT